jgi:hypothetical protein
MGLNRKLKTRISIHFIKPKLCNRSPDIESWILYGISQNAFLHENLIFKGGTVLKKAYFRDLMKHFRLLQRP